MLNADLNVMDLRQRVMVGVIVGVTVIFTIISLLLGRRKEEESEFTLTSSPEAPWERGGPDLTAPMTTLEDREAALDVSGITIEPEPLPEVEPELIYEAPPPPAPVPARVGPSKLFRPPAAVEAAAAPEPVASAEADAMPADVPPAPPVAAEPAPVTSPEEVITPLPVSAPQPVIVPEPPAGPLATEVSAGASVVEQVTTSGASVAEPEAVDVPAVTPESTIPLPANSRLRPADAFEIDAQPALLADVVHGLEQLPPLPKAAQAVLAEMDSAGSSARSVGEVVASDPVIGAAILRVVNSAANAMRRRVLTVKEAVAYLGFSNIRSIVMKLKLSPLFRTPSGQTQCYDGEALWQHSMAVAQVADQLAKRTGKADPDLASTLGLLHDIGKLAINSQFPHKVGQLWRPAGLIGGPAESWLARERRLFGADHAFLGAFLAARWMLPEELADGIRLHHLPAEMPLETVVEPVWQAVQVVHVANQLVKYRHVYCADMEIDPLLPELLSTLGLPGQIEQIFDEKIDRAIAAAALLAKGTAGMGDDTLRASA